MSNFLPANMSFAANLPNFLAVKVSLHTVYHDTHIVLYVLLSCLCKQMPRIWIDYCSFLMDQCKITRTRHAFDRALRALPLTQHRRVWPLYLKFVRGQSISETAIRVYRRYMKVCTQCCHLYSYSIMISKILV